MPRANFAFFPCFTLITWSTRCHMDNMDAVLLAEGQNKTVTFCLRVILQDLLKLILLNLGHFQHTWKKYCLEAFYKAAIKMLPTFRSVEYSSQLHPHKSAEIKSVIPRAVLENTNASLACTMCNPIVGLCFNKILVHPALPCPIGLSSQLIFSGSFFFILT